MDNMNVNFHQRNDIIKLQFFVHNQFLWPWFEDIIEYLLILNLKFMYSINIFKVHIEISKYFIQWTFNVQNDYKH